MKTDASWFSSRYVGRWLIVAIYLCILMFVYHLYQSSAYIKGVLWEIEHNETVNETKTRNINIFAATKFFGEPIRTERFMAKCAAKHSYCQITSNPDDLSNADAVVFHNADYRMPEIPSKVWSERKSEIPYILWGLESPSNDGFRPAGYVINWTMTYRKDADVFAPYGRIEKLEKSIEVDLDAIWDLKTKDATWLASNCHTPNRRFDIVKKIIDSGFDIDVWGSCGKQPPKCQGVNNQGSACVVDLIKPYKFYISIENSNCKDYVTEKFWKTLGNRMAVPIVLARKYYRDLGVPDSAYIAVEDFPTIAELVNYLKKLKKDKKLYLSYHEWRKNWRIVKEDDFYEFCSLCDILQDKEQTRKKSKVYKDVGWWHSFEMCNNSIANKYL